MESGEDDPFGRGEAAENEGVGDGDIPEAVSAGGFQVDTGVIYVYDDAALSECGGAGAGAYVADIGAF